MFSEATLTYQHTASQRSLILLSCKQPRFLYSFKAKMISNTYVGLSLLGICAVVGAGVGIGSGVAMIAQEAVKQEQQTVPARVPAAHSVFEKISIDRGFAAREA